MPSTTFAISSTLNIFDCASNTPPSTYSLRSSGRLFSRYKYPGINIDNSKKYKIIKKDRENHLVVIQWLFLIAYFFVTAFLFFLPGSKEVARRGFVKKVLLKILQKSKVNTGIGVPFLIKLRASGLQLY